MLRVFEYDLSVHGHWKKNQIPYIFYMNSMFLTYKFIYSDYIHFYINLNITVFKTIKNYIIG